MDIAFVVDMAQVQTDWMRQRGFIKQFITEYLYIGISQVRVAIVTYDSSSATVRIALSRYSTEDELKYAVDQITYTASGNADVTRALNLLIQTVFAVRISHVHNKILGLAGTATIIIRTYGE